MSKPIIEVENLSKKYQIGERKSYYALRDQISSFFDFKKPKTKTKDFWALKNISFTVRKGDSLGIIGRNGAGKSTLLKILSQITPPTTGKITMRGRVASLLEVGTGFHPELTGRENIFLNGAILGMSQREIKQKFNDIVNFAEIEKFLDTPVKRYSSGMYVRLAFAVAAHLEPEILIVDEVLAVGDTQFQKKCLGKMSQVGKEGRTVLFVSHNMAAINELCPKCILLDKGKIIDQGKTTQIVNQYLRKQYTLSGNSVDLTNNSLRRNSLENSLFKFTKLEIKNSKGQLTTSIGLMEPFEFIITGVLKKHTDNFSVGFSLNSSLGFPLFNSHKKIREFNIENKTGEIRFKIKFDNILGPGMYMIGIGANGEGITDWIPEAATINIEQVSTKGENLPINYDGVIIYPCNWSVL